MSGRQWHGAGLAEPFCFLIKRVPQPLPSALKALHSPGRRSCPAPAMLAPKSTAPPHLSPAGLTTRRGFFLNIVSCSSTKVPLRVPTVASWGRRVPSEQGRARSPVRYPAPRPRTGLSLLEQRHTPVCQRTRFWSGEGGSGWRKQVLLAQQPVFQGWLSPGSFSCGRHRKVCPRPQAQLAEQVLARKCHLDCLVKAREPRTFLPRDRLQPSQRSQLPLTKLRKTHFR